MSKTSKRNNKTNHRNDRLLITAMVIVLIGVMSIQIANLYQKRADYQQREVALQQQLDDETQRKEELENQAEYKQSQQFVEEIAKSRLGLVYPNEIIFREKD